MKQILIIAMVVFLFGCNAENQKIVEATGTLEATESLLGSQVSGSVIKIYVDEGTDVKTGDTLLLIDQTEYTLQLRQAEANAQSMYAQYLLALKGPRVEDIVQAEATLKSAEDDYKRMKELYNAKSITQKQFEDAETRYIVTKQMYEKLKRGSRQEEIMAARARYEQARAQCDILTKKINDCVIVAPFDGTITRIHVEKGELVAPGMTVARLVNLNEMFVRIYVSEKNLPRLSLHQQALIKVDAFPNKTFTGKVVFISPEAEFTPKNIQTKEERSKLVFAVKVKVDNQSRVLKAGIPADVTLQ